MKFANPMDIRCPNCGGHFLQSFDRLMQEGSCCPKCNANLASNREQIRLMVRDHTDFFQGVQFIVDIEDRWNIELPDEQTFLLTSFDLLCRYIEDSAKSGGLTPDPGEIRKEVAAIAARTLKISSVEPQTDLFGPLRRSVAGDLDNSIFARAEAVIRPKAFHALLLAMLPSIPGIILLWGAGETWLVAKGLANSKAAPPGYVRLEFAYARDYLHAAMWFLLPAAGFACLAFWRLKRFLAIRRAARGLCSKCGYDRRATPPVSKCPECGSPPPIALRMKAHQIVRRAGVQVDIPVERTTTHG